MKAPATRLDETFTRLRARGERALVAYLMAGDPSLAETGRLVIEAERRGADVIELGVPFSDPIADGPVIQRAGGRALAAGTTPCSPSGSRASHARPPTPAPTA